MKLFAFIVQSNIYLSLAAVFLTVETQIQLGMKPQWHPYICIIFFATLFEYNLQGISAIVGTMKADDSGKYQWIQNHKAFFYVFLSLSIVAFFYFLSLATREVLYTLLPLAGITLLYSTALFKPYFVFSLREIPYLKIFLIALVWSVATVLLPIIQSKIVIQSTEIFVLVLERFLFVFAITIPFDIRDREADKKAGLKTIPLRFNDTKTFAIAYLALAFFFIISLYHYQSNHASLMILPIIISAVTTFYFLHSKAIRKLHYYHYGILDGTLLFQGLLVVIVYFIKIT